MWGGLTVNHLDFNKDVTEFITLYGRFPRDKGENKSDLTFTVQHVTHKLQGIKRSSSSSPISSLPMVQY